MSFFVGFTFGAQALEIGKSIEEILGDLELARVNKIMFIAQDPWGSDFKYNYEY